MNSSKKRWTIVAVMAVFLAMHSAASSAGWFGQPEKIEGQVLDYKTKKPVEGAYVLAAYYHAGGQLFGHSARWCFRTRGSYTGADGRFSFPGEKDATVDLAAIKADYTEKNTPHVVNKETWTGTKQIILPDLFLVKRGTAENEGTTWVACERPNSSEDIQANVEYLGLMLIEARKYEKASSQEAIENTILLLNQIVQSKKKSL